MKKLIYSLENQSMSNIQAQQFVNLLIKAQSHKLGLSDQNVSKEDLMEDLRYIIDNIHES